MQPSNPKQSFTQDCAFLALTKLIRNKPLSSISVTELTKKAGISRTAFYNNYNSVEDVIAKYFDKCVDSILDSSDCIRGQYIAIRQLVSEYFDFLSSNYDLLKRLDTTGNISVFTMWLKDCFHGKLSFLVKSLGFLSDYEISCCAGMFCAMTRDWLASGSDDKSRNVAEGTLFRLLYIYKQAEKKSSVHYVNPRHIGKLRQYNGTGSFTLVDTGETIKVYVLIDHDEVVACSAEVTPIPGKEDILKAAANAVCSFIVGKNCVTALSLCADDVSRELSGLSKEFMYCASIASSAAKNAAIDYYNRLSLARCLIGEEESAASDYNMGI